MSRSSEPITRRLIHFTPLRYPGGKGKLAEYVKTIIEQNGLSDGHYVEPYAGGAAIALELLLQEYVSHIHINDLSIHVHSFWRSVLKEPEALCKKIRDTRCTVPQWQRQKKIVANPEGHSPLEIGFATFFLNRTNRSGILNGGIIGGKDQSGPWKIDARYNPPELIFRIQSIAKVASKISLTRKDAVKFITVGSQVWPKKTLIYCDPPYYEKGRDLYYDFYEADDHAAIAEAIQAVTTQSWIVSYDNVPAVNRLYKKCRSLDYGIGYSARAVREGSEVMFFGPRLRIPAPVGAMIAA